MPRLGPKRPLELGRSVIEFRLTAGDEDIKAILEAEGNLSGTIRKALRLYGQHRAGREAVPSPSPREPARGREAGAAQAAGDLLESLETNWQ